MNVHALCAKVRTHVHSAVHEAVSENTWQLLVSDQNRVVRLTFEWKDLITTTLAKPAGKADVLGGSLLRGDRDGPGAVARFNKPSGLQLLERFDTHGNSLLELYIADYGNHRVTLSQSPAPPAPLSPAAPAPNT